MSYVLEGFHPLDLLFGRIACWVVEFFFGEKLSGFEVGIGVWEGFRDFSADFWVEDEVDEFLGGLCVTGAFGDAEAVDVEVGSFFGNDPAKFRVGL